MNSPMGRWLPGHPHRLGKLKDFHQLERVEH